MCTDALKVYKKERIEKMNTDFKIMLPWVGRSGEMA